MFRFYISFIINFIRFIIGFFIYIIKGDTPFFGYKAMRVMFYYTNGYFNDVMSFFYSIIKGKYELKNINGILGNLNKNNVNNIVNNIEKNGYFISEKILDDININSLLEIAKNTKANIYPLSSKIEKDFFDENNIISVKYDFSEYDLIKNETIQKLITDESIFFVAQEYLGVKPIQDMFTMWWSTDFKKEADSEAAQLYHFDMDRIKFIKFFFYLTDVDEKNGPHCYISSSCKRKPKHLLRDGRFSDKEINDSYPKENLIEIKGKKGSIIIADTRGLHKGKNLLNGKRLIFQIEFCNSLFGAEYNKLNIENTTAKFKEKIQKYSYSYKRFFN